MSDLKNYFHMQDVKRAKRYQLNAAQAELQLASIRERLAEIKSQHEPIHSMLKQEGLDPRDMLYKIAHYVVVGWMPKDPAPKETD